jgi:hypothetical protein
MNRRSTLLIAACAWLVAPAHARKPPVHTAPLGRTGAGGHDVVAYFTDGAAVPGDRRFTVEWNGAEWRFASAANRDLFAAAPQQYAPQYGGYCAWAVAQGYTAPGDPRHWKVVDGRLYLNYDAEVQRRWERDIPGFIAGANRQWPGVLGP